MSHQLKFTSKFCKISFKWKAQKLISRCESHCWVSAMDKKHLAAFRKHHCESWVAALFRRPEKRYEHTLLNVLIFKKIWNNIITHLSNCFYYLTTYDCMLKGNQLTLKILYLYNTERKFYDTNLRLDKAAEKFFFVQEFKLLKYLIVKISKESL